MVNERYSNIFNINYKLDNIFTKYNIICLEIKKSSQEKYIKYADSDKITAKKDILSCYISSEKTLWVLTDKNTPLNIKYDTTIYKHKILEKQDIIDAPYRYVYLANLILNSLSKLLNFDKYHSNISGKLYILKTQKNGKFIKSTKDNYFQAYQIWFEQSSIDNPLKSKEVESIQNIVLRISEQTFNNYEDIKAQLQKKNLHKQLQYLESLPKYTISKTNYSLQPASAKDKYKYVNYGSTYLNRSKDLSDFYDFDYYSNTHEQTRSTIIAKVYKNLKIFHSECFEMIPKQLVPTRTIPVANKRKTSLEQDNDIYIVNTTGKDYTIVKNNFITTDEIVIGKRNIVIIEDKEYYKYNKLEDKYIKFNYKSDTAIQNVCINNLKHDYVINNITREVNTKYEIVNKKITSFDLKSLGIDAPIKIYTIFIKNKFKFIFSAIFYPDGCIEYLRDDTINTHLTADYLSEIKCEFVIEYKGNINLILNSNISAMSNPDTYTDKLVDISRLEYQSDKYLIFDSVLDTVINNPEIAEKIPQEYLKFFSYVKDHKILPNDIPSSSLEDSFESLLVRNLKDMKGNFEISDKTRVRKVLLKDIINKYRKNYECIRVALEDKGIYTHTKSNTFLKDQFPDMYDIDIYNYQTPEGISTLVYKVALSAKGIKQINIPRASLFKQVVPWQDSQIIEFLPDMLDVDFIAAGKPTVYPFIWKYLLEGFSDLIDSDKVSQN